MQNESPLETVLANHVAPLLHSAGFRSARTRFIRNFPGGTHDVDFATVEVQPDHLRVCVLVGVNTNGYSKIRNRAVGMFDRAPLLWVDPVGRDDTPERWSLDPSEMLGARLSSRLQDRWLAELALLSDFAWVEELLRTGQPFNGWSGFAAAAQARSLLFVIAAQRDDPDIDHFAKYVPDSDLWLPHIPRGR